MVLWLIGTIRWLAIQRSRLLDEDGLADPLAFALSTPIEGQKWGTKQLVLLKDKGKKEMRKQITKTWRKEAWNREKTENAIIRAEWTKDLSDEGKESDRSGIPPLAMEVGVLATSTTWVKDNLLSREIPRCENK